MWPVKIIQVFLQIPWKNLVSSTTDLEWYSSTNSWEPSTRRSRTKLVRLILIMGVHGACRPRREWHHVWRGQRAIPWEGEGRPPRPAGPCLAPAPQLSHLIPPLSHQSLVLRDPHLLAVNDASTLGSRPVAVVRVFLHMQLAQTGLLLIVGLLLGIGHGFPTSAWGN